MERVRVVVFGCLLALGLLFCPSAAYASDGFLGGLEDLTGSREVEDTRYEEVYLEDYRVTDPLPVVRENRTLDEDATTVDYVNDTLDQFNKVTWANGDQSFVWSIVYVLQGTQTGRLVYLAVGLVFLWWGVRKSVSMLIGAFRRGRITT